jgi:hypothetical protein
MAAPDILNKLESMGLRLEKRGGSIWVEPRDRITDSVRELIRAHKAELLKALAYTCPEGLRPRFERACRDLPLSADELATFLEDDLDDCRKLSDRILRFVAADYCLKLERYSEAVLRAWNEASQLPM